MLCYIRYGTKRIRLTEEVKGTLQNFLVAYIRMMQIVYGPEQWQWAAIVIYDLSHPRGLRLLSGSYSDKKILGLRKARCHAYVDANEVFET